MPREIITLQVGQVSPHVFKLFLWLLKRYRLLVCLVKKKCRLPGGAKKVLCAGAQCGNQIGSEFWKKVRSKAALISSNQRSACNPGS